MLREILTRVRFFISRKRPVDLDDELQFHLDQSTQTNIAAGMTPEEARRQAGIAFGGLERTREQCYEQRPGRLLEALLQDVRYARRWLGRSPVFTIAVITTLCAWHWRDYSRLQRRRFSAFAPTAISELRANRKDLEYVFSPRDE